MVLLRAPTEGNGSRRVKSMQNGEIDMPGNERVWTTAEVLRRTGRSPEPGELFWFLYDEWDEVLERQASGRLSLDSMLFYPGDGPARCQRRAGQEQGDPASDVGLGC